MVIDILNKGSIGATVWVSLTDDEPEVTHRNESFIIGVGGDRETAIREAIKELTIARERLLGILFASQGDGGQS